MKVDTAEYSILPDEELRDIYKSSLRVRRLLLLPLLALAYLIGLIGVSLANDVIDLRSDGGNIINWFSELSLIAAFVGCSFVLADDPVKHKSLTLKAESAIVLLMLFQLIFSHSLVTMAVQIGLLMAVAGTNMLAHPSIIRLHALRQHPRYPFDNWRRDDTYLNRASGDDVLRYIENTINSGKVQEIGYEEFFHGEKRAYDPPAPDPEKHLQQRTHLWRSSDKDTAYVLDNIHNMYFDDGADNGELKGEELERELIKATAPPKPPEPLPEDFFQQTPIVWRSKKHDTGSSRPKDPSDSNTDSGGPMVLM
ncbi:MAG: hypothetical protein IKP47_12330 [Ruminococcus sp.]|nr:hypothetical protein [Ruminococcus sp.]